MMATALAMNPETQGSWPARAETVMPLLLTDPSAALNKFRAPEIARISRERGPKVGRDVPIAPPNFHCTNTNGAMGTSRPTFGHGPYSSGLCCMAIDQNRRRHDPFSGGQMNDEFRTSLPFPVDFHLTRARFHHCP